MLSRTPPPIRPHPPLLLLQSRCKGAHAPVWQLISVYPATQSHVYMATRLLHVAPFRHGSGTHSLMSAKDKQEYVSGIRRASGMLQGVVECDTNRRADASINLWREFVEPHACHRGTKSNDLSLQKVSQCSISEFEGGKGPICDQTREWDLVNFGQTIL